MENSTDIYDFLSEAIQFSDLSVVESEKYLENLEKSKNSLKLLNNLKSILIKKGVVKDDVKKIETKSEKLSVDSFRTSESEKIEKVDVKKDGKKSHIFGDLHCDLDIKIAEIINGGYAIAQLIKLYDVKENGEHVFSSAFYDILGGIKETLQTFFIKRKEKIVVPFKTNVILLATFSHKDPLSDIWRKEKQYKLILKNVEVHNKNMLTTTFISRIITGLSESKFDFEQSGYTLLSLDKMVFNYAKTTPMTGGSYFEYQVNKYCINFKNTDEKCFYYNVCLFEFLQTNNRYNHKNNFNKILNWKSKFNFDGMEFPTGINDYELFSEQNKQNLIIYEENDDGIVEIYRSNHFENCEYIGMKLIHNENKTMRHLLYITNLNGYLCKNKKKYQKFCGKCIRYFSPQEYEYHSCTEKTDVKYKYCENSHLEVKFKDYATELPTFTRVYCDFECINDIVEIKCKDENGNEYIEKKTVQNPITVGLKVCNDFHQNMNMPYEKIHGRDCAGKFLKRLLKIKSKSYASYNELRKKHKYPKLTEEEEKEFRKCIKCAFCEEPGACYDELPFFEEMTKCKGLLRDHCHLTGKYRQALCFKCNINFNDKLNKNRGGLIVMFHNSKGYDTHILMQEMYKIMDKEKTEIRAIATTIDKYISFEYSGMKFLDTWSFLNSSLSSLCETMDHKDFIYTNKEFGELSVFLRQKQEYPYSWVDSEEKFKCTKLPEKQYFYNDLRKEECSDNAYNYALNVWKKAGCKTFQDYHDLYLKVDVLTMCDIFEKFRKSQKEDPFNCVTINSLSWSKMMKTCKQKLGYIKNDYQRLFLNRGQRGGVCQTGVYKHVKANNKYMTDFDDKKPSNFIIYVDMNGLYGGVMQDQYLPHELINDEPEYMTFDELMALGDDVGCFVKLNIYYPTDEKQRQYIRGYTPFPHKSETNFSKMSKEQQDYFIKNNKANVNTDFFGGSKLIMDFVDKKNYVCLYKNIQYIHSLNLGFRFEPCSDKGFEVLKFNAKKWLSPYIAGNALNRAKTENEIERNMWKLLSNAIYGKMQEKVDERKNFNITNDEKKSQKLVNKSTHCQGYALTDENDNDVLFFNLNRKTVIKYDKFQYIGNAILDYSKLYMMKYYYDYLKPKYGDKVTFLYTDTDSLIFNVECDDFYNDCFNDRVEWYDLSNVKIDKFKCKKNKGVNGKMKLEDKMIPIVEAVFLNPKVYSMKFDKKFYDIKVDELIEERDKKINKFYDFYDPVDSFGLSLLFDCDIKFYIDSIYKDYEEQIKSITFDKGTKKGVTKSIHIPIEEYVKVVETKENRICNVTQIKSKQHKIYVENLDKVGLTPYDTKQKTIGNVSFQFGF